MNFDLLRSNSEQTAITVVARRDAKRDIRTIDLTRARSFAARTSPARAVPRSRADFIAADLDDMVAIQL